MMDDQELYDLLDQYVKGTLSHEQSLGLKKKMMTDSEFRARAEEHLKVLKAIRLYGRREAVRRSLEKVELEAPASGTDNSRSLLGTFSQRSWKKLWPVTAVAASVALFSIVGTLLVSQFLEKERTARYIELVRNVEQSVEQIKESQNKIISNIAETKEKAAPKRIPGRYAGTGFLVSSNGYVVTSHHVVKGADSVYIENSNHGNLKATVVYSDAANDVAVLRIENPELKLPKLPYTISASEANLGEDVFTLGFPREDIVFGEGAISALSGFRQNPNSYQVSVPVNPGNSGGPLFNAKGDLVGIISGIQTETSGAAFAIKSSVLLDVIKNIPADSTHSAVLLPKYNSLRHLSKVDQVNRWKDNVFIVRVYNNK
jgi:serine protease Do